jgi:hypothetical protein
VAGSDTFVAVAELAGIIGHPMPLSRPAEKDPTKMNLSLIFPPDSKMAITHAFLLCSRENRGLVERFADELKVRIRP